MLVLEGLAKTYGDVRAVHDVTSPFRQDSSSA